MNRLQMSIQKVNKIVLNVLTVAATVLFFIIMYWLLWPYKIIEYNVDRLEMVKDEYVVGEPLTYRISFCKYGDSTGTVLRFVRDTVVYSYPTIQSKIEGGCHDFVSSSNLTPNVPTGIYIFENDVVYQVNPLREIKYHMESTQFKIINPN